MISYHCKNCGLLRFGKPAKVLKVAKVTVKLCRECYLPKKPSVKK